MSSLDVLFSSNEQKDFDFEFKGIKIKVKVKDISWSVKNKILGECFDYKSSGVAKFDFDQYNKKMLKEMVVGITVGDSVVPPGELNDVFFARINPAFGSLLEKIVPKAFEDVGADFFAKG